MSTYPTSLEALLRDACRRAMAHGLSFTNQIRLYRSIIALAREVRLRIGGHKLDIDNGGPPPCWRPSASMPAKWASIQTCRCRTPSWCSVWP